MTVNASAHRIRILVGDDQQDWSDAMISLDVGRSKYDRSGLSLISGTLVLGWMRSNPESIDPRDNPSRWFRGCRILVEIVNNQGQWVRHPLGCLYVTREPLPPLPDQAELTLQVGCKLTLRDWVEPIDVASAAQLEAGGQTVEFGQETARHAIIQGLLQLAGVGALTGLIPEKPMAYALSWDLSTSIVRQAGAIAFAAGYALKQNNQGGIEVVKINIPKSGADIPAIKLLNIGYNEINYEPIEGSETPAEIVKAVGQGFKLREKLEGYELNDTIYGSIVEKNTTWSGTVVRQTYIKDEWTDGRSEHKRLERVRQPAVQIPAYPILQGINLIIANLVDSTSYYQISSANTGRLVERIIKTRMPRSAILKDYYQYDRKRRRIKEADYVVPDGAVDYEAERVTYTYVYDIKDRVKEIIKITQRWAGAILPELGTREGYDATAWEIAEIDKQSWEETRQGEWLYRQQILRTMGEVYADLKKLKRYGKRGSSDLYELLALTTYQSKTESSRSGQAQPPATERAPGRWELEEIQIAGRAEFGQIAGTQNQKRERVIEIKYADKELLDAIADREGRFLIGRRLGQQVQIAMVDEMFSDRILPRIDCLEPQGITRCLLADNISYSHDQERAIVGFDGIWMGQVENGLLKLPYRLTNLAQGGLRTGGRVERIVTARQRATRSVVGGLRVGGIATVSVSVARDATGGLRIGGSATVGIAVTRDAIGGLRVGGSATVGIAVTRDAIGGLRVGGIAPLLSRGQFSPLTATLQGPGSLTQIVDFANGIDDSAIGLGDIGFDFPLFGATYRSDIYVGSNSYVTFGFGSNVYSSLSATNPGRGLLIDAADRSVNRVWAGREGDIFRIRFEGNASTSGNGSGLIWELTLFPDGALMLVSGAMPPNGGLSSLSDGISSFSYTLASNVSLVFQPNSGAALLGYTLQNGSYSWV
jgi:hypothetical protein